MLLTEQIFKCLHLEISQFHYTYMFAPHRHPIDLPNIALYNELDFHVTELHLRIQFHQMEFPLDGIALKSTGGSALSSCE